VTTFVAAAISCSARFSGCRSRPQHLMSRAPALASIRTTRIPAAYFPHVRPALAVSVTGA
jgi:hypothetical protein